jgi:predicted PurR-regulated permease PerM
MSSQPTVLTLVNHITTNDDAKNKFTALLNEVPAPHSNDLQQQLQHLQAQMRQLQQQLQGWEETTPTWAGSIVPSVTSPIV